MLLSHWSIRFIRISLAIVAARTFNMAVFAQSVEPNSIKALKVAQASAVSGQRDFAIILLMAPAGKQGVSVSLTAIGEGRASLSMPETVTIPAGKSAAAFPFTVARNISSPLSVRLQARLGDASPQEAMLALVPISVGSLEFIPGTLVAGHDVTVLVTLNQSSEKPIRITLSCEAPGITIDPKAASLLSSGTVPLFRVSAARSNQRRTVTLRALANGQILKKTITILPSSREGNRK
ncbi:MAG: hypothetical protein QM758_13595 [Armatimonas sp.]